MSASHILEQLCSSPEYVQARLLILGLDCSGKTTILKCLSNEDITTVAPTQVSLAHVHSGYNSGCNRLVTDVRLCDGSRDSMSSPS